MFKVIISNGHFKFILGPAAAEASKRKVLDCYITGGYPTRKLKRLISLFRLDRFDFIARLLSREEAIPEKLIHTLWFSELIVQFGKFVKKINQLKKYSEWFDAFSLRIYGYQSEQIIRKSTAEIYHYRSGYGGNSLKIARQKGMLLLCDHSIAHPATVDYLIENKGSFSNAPLPSNLGKFWTCVLNDVNQADHVVVNSHFVKQTFLNQGWDSDQINVVYTGLDNDFLNMIGPRSTTSEELKPIRLMFAGDFGNRKGGDLLINALQKINDLPWNLQIVGNIDPVLSEKHNSFLTDQRVSMLGFVPRLELVKLMNNADVFIFPSLAEGSARVIFMAMACGLYVITTPNSGSIVEDLIHGSLIQPGNIDELELAVRKVLAMDREEIFNIGSFNAKTIRTSFTQRQYGENLLELYKVLLKNRVNT